MSGIFPCFHTVMASERSLLTRRPAEVRLLRKWRPLLAKGRQVSMRMDVVTPLVFYRGFHTTAILARMAGTRLLLTSVSMRVDVVPRPL